ncbi:unnamed protein product [Symbiodinium microadriaticum]|nr:unnamed protein product [Symbiodinium microadriaticum]
MYDTDEVLREILGPSTMTSTSTDGTPSSAVDNLQDGGFLADLLAENTMNDVGSSPAWTTSTTWTTLATLSTSSGVESLAPSHGDQVGDASGEGADPATDRAGGAEDDGGELDAVDGDCADCMVGGDGEISGEEEHAMDRGLPPLAPPHRLAVPSGERAGQDGLGYDPGAADDPPDWD